MRNAFSRLLVGLLVLPLSGVFPIAGQDPASQQTRPRRAGETWPTGNSEPPVVVAARIEGMPTIRIGLSTDARSATISTSGKLYSLVGAGEEPALLNVARVRVESRSLTPLPADAGDDIFGVEIAGAATRVDADRAASEIRQQTGEQTDVALDARTNTWRVRIGGKLSHSDAETLQSRLEDAGFASAAIVGPPTSNKSADVAVAASRGGPTSGNSRSQTTVGTARPPTAGEITANTGRSSSSSSQPSGSSAVRTVSRTSTPSREIAVFASGAPAIFSSRSPVTFSSDNEQASPVRFNDKPYRGRIEVFPNTKGALTVVNVLNLEDYVRGVVPNELSPGGYPSLEAQKAQAVAARTYALRNLNQFASQGFDLLPTIRSQVYGGLSTEHPLSTRAVEETRGIVATYMGAPINALYTSTCGGRTEDAESIFNEAVPYLRSRECALEGRAHFAPFIVKTSRELADIRDEANATFLRDVAVLGVNGFQVSSIRVTDEWLTSPATSAEVSSWLSVVARVSRQGLPMIDGGSLRPGGFSTALAAAFYGPARADTLLDNADVEYILDFRDASEIPTVNRADVAMLLRDGSLSLYADGSLRPQEPMTRGRMLRAISRLLESRNNLQLQKGTARPTANGMLILRSSKNRDQSIAVSRDAYLFRAFANDVYQVRSIPLVGGEPVTYHVGAGGQVDYLEVRPAPNGAAAERFSPFTNWTSELSLSQAQARLSRWARGIGSLTDLHIAQRGSSRRVTDLELVGTSGIGHVRGGRIRSALGLREQLFVIDRRYGENGNVIAFTFTGRGWGHGVGMCQVGAYGLAREGMTYDRILKVYYTGIELTKMY